MRRGRTWVALAAVLVSCATSSTDGTSRPTLRDDEVILDPRFDGLPSVDCPAGTRPVKISALPEACWTPPCTGLVMHVCGLLIPAGRATLGHTCLGSDGTEEGPVLVAVGVEIVDQGACMDGRAEGVWRRWYLGGQLAEEVTYRDGVREGPFRYWERDGRVMDEGTMHHGLVVGPEASGR